MGEVCLVTGANGFVGAALCRRLLADGHAVRGLDLRFAPGPAPQLHRLQGDVNDDGLLAEACRGAACVFHLAAVLPQRKRPPDAMRRVNVGGTERLLAAARAAAVRRLVLLSSCEVYGVPRATPCPEDAPLRPIGEYGRNKVEAERLALAAHGLDVVILRPPTIVGPGMPEPLLRTVLGALRRGGPILVPAGATRLQVVAVADVVTACLLAAAEPRAAGQIFNLGAGDPGTLLHTARAVRDRLRSRSPIVPVPAGLARAGLRLLAATGRSPLEPEHLAIAFADYVFDTQRAERVLGWRPALGTVEALAGAAGAV